MLLGNGPHLEYESLRGKPPRESYINSFVIVCITLRLQRLIQVACESGVLYTCENHFS